MKAVILAGGLGTRLSEETTVRPKPMVEIGERPILWHIMKSYSAYGINDFVICCGYKSWVIKEYFSNYILNSSNVTFDLKNNEVHIHGNKAEPWRVTLVDTGENAMTGGRLKRVREYLEDETFCFTYGDGLCDANIAEEIAFHKELGVKATMLAVQPAGRFGVFNVEGDNPRVTHFREKPKGDGAWINGGYFVLEPEAIDYIDDESTSWEKEPLERLAANGDLAAFKHVGFWQPMDTLRDKQLLEGMWQSGNAPWKRW